MELQKLTDSIIRKKDEVNVFGIVLYTDAHAHVKKVLRDPDYWKSFGEISGDNWPVFAIRADPARQVFPTFPEGMIGYMVPVREETNKNKEFMAELELDDTRNLPLFVVFAQDPDGLLVKKEIRISDESKEDAYRSLNSAVDLVSRAVKGISPENRGAASARCRPFVFMLAIPRTGKK